MTLAGFVVYNLQSFVSKKKLKQIGVKEFTKCIRAN
jgi:hypothetical protein